MRISDWSSVVCSSDLADVLVVGRHEPTLEERRLVIGVVAVFVGVVRLEGGWLDGGICHDQRSEVGAGATGAAAGVGMVGAATGAAAPAPAAGCAGAAAASLGRASGGESVCQSVCVSVFALALTNKQPQT